MRISYAALNRRDHWIRLGLCVRPCVRCNQQRPAPLTQCVLTCRYPGIAFPAVLGADCCGQVAAVHESSSHRRLLGKRVGYRLPRRRAGPRLVRVCADQDRLAHDLQVLLDSSIMWGDHEKAPTPMFHLLGMVPAGGTLGEYVVVQAEQVYEVPDHLTCPQAAALPLAGLTGCVTRPRLRMCCMCHVRRVAPVLYDIRRGARLRG